MSPHYKFAEKVADVGAGGSVAMFMGLTLTEWDTVMSIALATVGVIAACLAIAFHIMRMRALRRNENGKLRDTKQD